MTARKGNESWQKIVKTFLKILLSLGVSAQFVDIWVVLHNLAQASSDESFLLGHMTPYSKREKVTWLHSARGQRNRELGIAQYYSTQKRLLEDLTSYQCLILGMNSHASFLFLFFSFFVHVNFLLPRTNNIVCLQYPQL